ncbi:hypothetical protein Nepgr_017937 [Nepenthes gracilis]|uniref:Protein kinase domain-containing protein n=1 Tax=Nepenthes gracilis TaxID=150966 RepID=A0AAD3XTT6_NEPGR|nr:hypothetical protein Nepgr_017937 [Nepenthes gracilis]
MEDSSSIGLILEFLQRNGFSRAEAALRSELANQPDTNGFEKLSLQEKDACRKVEEENAEKLVVRNQETSSQHGGEVSKELIVKEIECGSSRNGLGCKRKTSDFTAEHNAAGQVIGTSDRSFSFSKPSEDNVLDLHSWKLNSTNGIVDPFQSGGSMRNPNLLEPHNSGKLMLHTVEAVDMDKKDVTSGEEVIVMAEKRTSWMGSTSKANVDAKYERSDKHELGVIDQRTKHNFLCSEDDLLPTNEQDSSSSSDRWKEYSVKTVFPFPNMDAPAYDSAIGSGDKKESKRKTETDVRAAIKEQVDEVGRSLYLAKLQGIGDENNLCNLGLSLGTNNQKEELPRLPPVRLKSEDKSLIGNWEEKFDHDRSCLKHNSADNTYLIGSYLDIPVGQEISSAGGKRIPGGSWLSVSQCIAEDASDLVSGFATIGDGLSESIDYPNEYWDSDEYDDDEDVGYMRQPIEDEAWFLAHEVDYTSDNEKVTGHGSVPDLQDRAPAKVEDDDQSFAEDDSYFSGEPYLQSKNVEPVSASDDPIGLLVTEMYGRAEDNDLISQYNGHLMDEEELNLMRSEPVWQGFVSQSNDLIMLGDGKAMSDRERPRLDDICMDDEHHGSWRSIGVGINSDAADIGSEVPESLIGGSSEGGLEYFHDHKTGIGGYRHPQTDFDRRLLDRSTRDKKRNSKHDLDKDVMGNNSCAYIQVKHETDSGFLFPPHVRDGHMAHKSSSQTLWSSNSNVVGDDTNDGFNAVMGNDDMLASWRHKTSDSSSIRSSRDKINATAVGSAESTPSTISDYGYTEKECAKKENDEKMASSREEDAGASLEDEETALVQEQVRQIKAQEEEFETFNLKIVHRKNRTGFEEDKNFHVILNSVIAGRYHVTEYLGSAAFSKAIQAHDLHTSMDVCVKIIKNNKDFFDQSLDEIKLLKFINKHDPADKHHILRLYDYFYYREHLLIVCELLKANLYEFHKFNRESGGEVYFTMPRLQSITIQVLEALQFLHGLGLIHCDLKPENILVKSYSRCEVKVIDLGSSCFETDHLCSYVQSRSYRAPEVILGLPYDKKIDIWSLGCILAELCTGNVLFQNDSTATLLARVIGIIGPIDQEMLAKGRDTYKYFTKNHMLYERNQETNRLEYLIPKKTSLRHRLPMGDQGFIDFAAYLLEINPRKRPSASEALKHPWLSYPYEPISS